MKKSINIGLILFLLLQACSGPENSENQIINEPSPQDTSVNSSVKPGNPPPPPAGNNPTQKTTSKTTHQQTTVKQTPHPNN